MVLLDLWSWVIDEVINKVRLAFIARVLLKFRLLSMHLSMPQLDKQTQIIQLQQQALDISQ